MNTKMGSKEIFQLLSILDRIQVEVEYLDSFRVVFDRIRDILLDVRKFEQEHGLQTPNFHPEGASK